MSPSEDVSVLLNIHHQIKMYKFSLIIFIHFAAPDTSNYWILDTDYDNYSIVFSCKNLSKRKSAEAAWLLSKTRTLNPDISDKVNDMMRKYFDYDAMRTAKQSKEM